MIHVRCKRMEHDFRLTSDAGAGLRPLGSPVHEHGRPVGLADPDGFGSEVHVERPLTLTHVGVAPSGALAVVLRRSGDLSEELKNPIPSRTRPLNSSAPMVLCLKTRESRSLPGLPRTNSTPRFTRSTPRTRRFFIRAPRSCLSPLLPSKPALKAHRLGFGEAKLARVAAGWSSPVARQAHNPKVTGSNPVPATRIRKAVDS